MKDLLFLLICIFLGTASLVGQDKGEAHDLRRTADKAYEKKNFEKAEEAYRKATILDPDEKGTFNLGNTVFKQNRYDEAARHYEKALSMADNDEARAKALYNLGNTYYLDKKYDKSVESFKQSLMVNPKDLQAKQNFLMALREQKIQQQQEQQQQQNEPGDKEDDKKDQQESQPQDQDQNQEKEDSSEQDQNQEDQEEQPQQDQEQKLTKEQAMKLLNIIEEEDKKVQEKLRKGKDATQKKKSKDW